MSGDELPLGGLLLLAGFFAVMLVFGVVAERLTRERRRERGRVYRNLGAFVRHAERALKRGGLDPRVSYLGAARSGRRVRANLVGSPTARVRLAVSTTRDAPPVGVRLEGPLQRLWKALGREEDIVTGDWLFDGRFFLESASPAKGKDLLGEAMRRAIVDAFARFGAARLELRPGELCVELPVGATPPARWRDVLAHLERVAVLVETRPLAVRVLEGERNAACDGAGALRCVYCREQVTGEEPDLVACERCRTVVHDACWSEHGSCPVLGCEGRAAERGRARARLNPISAAYQDPPRS